MRTNERAKERTERFNRRSAVTQTRLKAILYELSKCILWKTKETTFFILNNQGFILLCYGQVRASRR
jgi:hypothetical protein